MRIYGDLRTLHSPTRANTVHSTNCFFPAQFLQGLEGALDTGMPIS